MTRIIWIEEPSWSPELKKKNPRSLQRQTKLLIKNRKNRNNSNKLKEWILKKKDKDWRNKPKECSWDSWDWELSTTSKSQSAPFE